MSTASCCGVYIDTRSVTTTNAVLHNADVQCTGGPEPVPVLFSGMSDHPQVQQSGLDKQRFSADALEHPVVPRWQGTQNIQDTLQMIYARFNFSFVISPSVRHFNLLLAYPSAVGQQSLKPVCLRANFNFHNEKWPPFSCGLALQQWRHPFPFWSPCAVLHYSCKTLLTGPYSVVDW